MPSGGIANARFAHAAGGRRVCFAEWGDSWGTPVFSLHGTPGCRLLWARAIEHEFEDLVRSLGVRFITYDRPGYGQSERNEGRRVADSAADVAAIADALGIGRFAIEATSSGSGHALAAAALLADRVIRVACIAPMAPFSELGREEWTNGAAPEVQDYVDCVLAGPERMTEEFRREDANMRSAASADDPAQADVFEQTANGVAGWVDDEIAAFAPWGFDLAAIRSPTAFWYNPADEVLPAQHARWLKAAVAGSTLDVTDALGHGATGDPVPAWRYIYGWLGGTNADG